MGEKVFPEKGKEHTHATKVTSTTDAFRDLREMAENDMCSLLEMKAAEVLAVPVKESSKEKHYNRNPSAQIKDFGELSNMVHKYKNSGHVSPKTVTMVDMKVLSSMSLSEKAKLVQEIKAGVLAEGEKFGYKGKDEVIPETKVTNRIVDK